MAFKLSPQASIVLPYEKRQRKLLIVFGLIVLTTLGVLYFGFWRSPGPAPSPGVISPEPVPEEEWEPELYPPTTRIADLIKKIDFDIDFLKDPNFQALELYGEWPLKIEEQGRPNPFSPY